MPLQFTVDSLDTIPETQRGLYKEENGKFRLDLDGYEDPIGLKSALEKERKAAGEASKQVKAWAALGKSPEEIAALIAEQQKSEEDKARKGGDFEKIKEQMVSKHNAELTKKDERIKRLTGNLERRLIDADATAAIAAAKGVPALLLPHVRAATRVVEEGDEFKVQVVDASGTPRVNGKGEPLSIADLVSEMRQSEVFGRAFEPSGNSGSGTGPSGRVNGKLISESAFNALPPKERAKRMAEGYSVA